MPSAHFWWMARMEEEEKREVTKKKNEKKKKQEQSGPRRTSDWKACASALNAKARPRRSGCLLFAKATSKTGSARAGGGCLPPSLSRFHAGPPLQVVQARMVDRTSARGHTTLTRARLVRVQGLFFAPCYRQRLLICCTPIPLLSPPAFSIPPDNSWTSYCPLFVFTIPPTF